MNGMLAEITSLFAGETAMRRLVAAHRRPMQLLIQRETVRARLESDLTRRSAALDEAMQESLIAPYVEFLEHELPELNRRCIMHSPILASPSGKAWTDFLQSALDQMGAVAYHDITSALREATFEVLMFLVHPTLSVSADPKVPFEVAVRFCVDALCEVAQEWYRPVLRAAAQLTQRMRHSGAGQSSELGAVMAQCRQLWAGNRGPVAVLDEDVRIIRNSTAHSEDRTIDPLARTVTFINRPRNAPPEQLGPLDRLALHELLFRVFTNWLAMANALASFDRTDGETGDLSR